MADLAQHMLCCWNEGEARDTQLLWPLMWDLQLLYFMYMDAIHQHIACTAWADAADMVCSA